MRSEPNRAGEMAAFVRVVEAGGFAPAGRALGLSPSAMSKLITRLEQRLGATLLRRSTRRVALTPEGERFHRRAVGILAEIDAAEREAGGAAQPAGRVRINSSASYVTHVLADLLPGFLGRYPAIDVDVVQTDVVADLLQDGSDIAVRAGELPASSLVARSLGSTPLIVVVGPAWLARHGMPRTPDDLMASDRIGYAYPRAVGDWLSQRDPTPERVRISDGEGVRRLALAGLGPARLAEFTVQEDLAAGRLVQLFPGALPQVLEPFHAIYVGQSRQLPARARALLEWLTVHGRVDRVGMEDQARA